MKEGPQHPDPNRERSSISTLDDDSNLEIGNVTGHVATQESTRAYTEAGSPQFSVHDQLNQSQNQQISSNGVKPKVLFPQNVNSSYPVTTDSTTNLDEVQPTTTPINLKKPIAGPNAHMEFSTCPRCGLKIDAADTKMIPTQKIWFSFALLFCCGCWWMSWIPFFCKKCYDPIEICPHCFRRLRRAPVGSNSISVKS